MKKIFYYIITPILFTGCIALHSGVIAPNSLSLNQDNFYVKKTIYGESKASYFLGIGGYLREGLVKEAKKECMIHMSCLNQK